MPSQAAIELTAASLEKILPELKKYIEERIEINVHTLEQNTEWVAKLILIMAPLIDEKVGPLVELAEIGVNLLKPRCDLDVADDPRVNKGIKEMQEIVRIKEKLLAGWGKGE